MQGNKSFARASAQAQHKAAIATAALALAIDEGHRTTEAIARRAGQRVIDAYHRLTRSGPSMLNRNFRFFTKDGDNWGLTERGRELVAACRAEGVKRPTT